MTTLESRLMALPLRQPSAGFVDRVLAERPVGTRLSSRTRWRWAWPAAAAILVLSVAALWPWHVGSDRRAEPTIANSITSPNTPAPAALAVSFSMVDGPSHFSEGLAAQRNPVTGNLGFVDTTGRWVIPPTFDYNWTAFQDGLALVGVSIPAPPGRDVLLQEFDRFFIDHAGQKVAIANVDAQGRKFSFCSAFSSGLAVIYQDDQYGYADRQGRVVIPPRYKSAMPFSEGLAQVSEQADDSQGKGIYFIDPSGKAVVTAVRLMGGSEGFREGLAAVRTQENRKYGYIGRDGKFVIEAQFVEAHEFSEGLAAVLLKEGVEPTESHKWGYIDRTGRLVIAASFLRAGPFHEGLAAVATGAAGGDPAWAFVDRTGKVVIPSERCGRHPGRFAHGLARVHLPPGQGAPDRDGYIDHEGKLATVRVLELPAELKPPVGNDEDKSLAGR